MVETSWQTTLEKWHSAAREVLVVTPVLDITPENFRLSWLTLLFGMPFADHLRICIISTATFSIRVACISRNTTLPSGYDECPHRAACRVSPADLTA